MKSKESFLKTTEYIIFPVLAGILVFWCLFYRNHLLFQEESDFFVMTSAYFKTCITQPGGLSLYIGNFLAQCFRWPIIGALIYTLILWLIWIFVKGFNTRIAIGKTWTIATLCPVLLLAALQMNCEYPVSESVKALFFFATAFFYLRINKPGLRMLLVSFLFPLFFLLFSYVALLALYIVFFIYEIKQGKGKSRFIAFLIWITLLICYPLFWQARVCILSDKLLYALTPQNLLPFPEKLMYIFYGWLVILLLVSVIFNRKRKVPEGNFRLYICNISLCGIIGFYILTHSYQHNFEYIEEIDLAVRQERWDDALKTGKSIQNPSPEMIYYTTLALAGKEELADKLFEYPVKNLQSLYLPRTLDYFRLLQGSELYYQLGIYNEAIRWTFEAAELSTWGMNFRTLKRLTDLYMKNGDFKLAEKYLSILERTSFQGSWVKEKYHEMEKLKAENPSGKKHGADFFIGGREFLSDMARVYDAQSAKPIVADYLLCGLLLKKDIKKFYSLFKICYPPQAIKVIPKAYAEALLLAITLDEKGVAGAGYTLPNNLHEAFTEYNQLLNYYKTTSPEAKAAMQKFRNSWWYYCHFSE